MFVTRKALDAFLQESHKPYILLTHPGQLLQPQAQLRGNENTSVTRIRLLIILPRLLFFFFFYRQSLMKILTALLYLNFLLTLKEKRNFGVDEI